ncbi:hypothetical protein A3863_14200 [Priestia endophytica]|nr:hypothetical protein A3863_14200 [Priestia endophytica]
MYQTIQINRYILEIDIEKTKNQYLNDWDLCGCLYCLNFYQVMESLPEVEFQFFNRLGVNPSKCNHVSHFEPGENGLHLYIGCYHIVGIISPECITEAIGTDEVIEVSNTLKISFSNDLEFVLDRFTNPVLQLDFEIEVPWVIQGQS